MTYVNMLEAKSSLSRLVEDVELGREKEIIIARGGRPVARLVPLATATPVELRIGVAKGAFEVPDEIDAHNDEVAALFTGGGA
ncbi:type II toxin-antitoxin system Phd/YefM family antitoxin [Paraburkholderia sp. Ac-20347]|jgi:antitoxin (DNA-binding transcriptional repressor) of toxin-antitoxin stability system|uniref:type II toxin-antitoxin system Phd/YefM family antitoxin n=1 Tax=Paraburkholderia sp. Ac-20347 TaxID=2703892 RepID=UPI00197FAA63|nr:type II toxin-antitoxin system Phd/YefM family antitoxin [Paraburkholderia sp. Ac-20347]MBN3810201.1 prevent-host-death protein [Paraburkholderia sp. Ac-20347]